MRTTLDIDEAMLESASQLTGVRDHAALVHMALKTLIARASAARLATLGGTEKKLKSIHRRRSR